MVLWVPNQPLWNFKHSCNSAGNFNCQFCKDCSFSKIIFSFQKFQICCGDISNIFLNIFEKSKIEAVEWRVNELTFWWDGSPTLPLTIIYQSHDFKSFSCDQIFSELSQNVNHSCLVLLEQLRLLLSQILTSNEFSYQGKEAMLLAGIHGPEPVGPRTKSFSPSTKRWVDPRFW